MEFEVWHIWLIASIVFFILEIIIPSFVVFNLGVGALFATISSVINVSVEWQLFVFCVFTIISFFLIRPILIKWAYTRSDKISTNFNAYVGRHAVVVDTINSYTSNGSVKLDGSIWQARAIKNEIIEPGKTICIKKVDSIVFEVESVSE